MKANKIETFIRKNMYITKTIYFIYRERGWISNFFFQFTYFNLKFLVKILTRSRARININLTFQAIKITHHCAVISWRKQVGQQWQIISAITNRKNPYPFHYNWINRGSHSWKRIELLLFSPFFEIFDGNDVVSSSPSTKCAQWWWIGYSYS